jgi:hypothetical protein
MLLAKARREYVELLAGQEVDRRDTDARHPLALREEVQKRQRVAVVAGENVSMKLEASAVATKKCAARRKNGRHGGDVDAARISGAPACRGDPCLVFHRESREIGARGVKRP